MPKKPLIGGQAVFEGVMMRSPKHLAVAVRTHNGRIAVNQRNIRSIGERYPVLKWPFIRGTIALYENLAIGMKAMLESANQAASDEEQLKSHEMVLTVIFAVATSLFLFLLLPLIISNILIKSHGFFFNLLDGIMRMIIFLSYLLFISLFKDVRRIFRYHGAEHMAVHAYEHGKKLTVKNVKPFTTLHPRCGTSFLLIVVIMSIFLFSLIQTENFLQKFLTRIALVPVLAGVSYELLRTGALRPDHPLIRVLIIPGLLLQKITTMRPDDGQIKVAIAALNKVIQYEKS